jgi:ankyrin repeat protein
MKLLIQWKCDTSARNKMGRTPLHHSAQEGYPDVCEYLLQREAELESLDEDHSTPFLLAAHFGHVNVMKLLIQWKCDTSARNKVG